MIDRRLARQLEQVAELARSLRYWSALTGCWVVLAAVGWVLVANPPTEILAPRQIAALVLCAAGLLAVLTYYWSRRAARDPHRLAREIEQRYPDLNASLVTAIEQSPQLPGGRFGFLQEHVIQRSLKHAKKHAWTETLSPTRMRWTRLAHHGAAIALVIAISRLALAAPPDVAEAGTEKVPEVPEVATRLVTNVEVEPGDVELERGRSLLVSARFDEESVPGEATLVLESESTGTSSRPLARSLDDPLFGGRVAQVQHDLSYRIEFPGGRTQEYQVTVFEFPVLVRADAVLRFPDYTGMPEERIDDFRRLTAVEGSELTLLCHLNKAVEQAVLRNKGGEQVASLTPQDEGSKTWTTSMVLRESLKLRLHLTDSAGRANREPPEFIINVRKNKAPKIRILTANDLRVSPLEETVLEAKVSDDYGMAQFGLSYRMAGDMPVDVVLGETTGRRERRDIEHLLAFEELEAEPDELLAWHFWAEDVGPDQEVRRTTSDLFFAEVRPFEEIFREGEEQPGGQERQQDPGQQMGGQAGEQAKELAELQKQTIQATWNLMRREAPAEDPDFSTDTEVVRDAQAEALDLGRELIGTLPEGEMLESAEQALQHMELALEELEAAVVGPTPERLPPALDAEQAAYQELLRLRAREFEVTRGRRQQQGGQRSQGGGGNRSRAQLQQLELQSDENRYETQTTANSNQDSQGQREARQALNRLRELARRQEDVNKELQELQAELAAAESAAEEEELRKRLQRLREEEQEILRDTDELRDRLEQGRDTEQVAEARDRLEETREDVRRTSEAIEEGEVSQALAAGTRASNDFEDLREDFRRAVSGEFEEEMREMRQEAQDLEARTQELTQNLEETSQPNSVEESRRRLELQEGFEDQQEALEALLTRMQETVEEAEESEPLLAEELYDSIRQARQDQVGESMRETEQLVRRGFLEDAKDSGEEAREGVTELREGVERAAEKVLGDGTRALELAREELERLNQELEEELRRASDPQEGQPGEGQLARNEPGEQQGQQGQQPGEQQGQQGQQPGEQQGQQGQQGQQPGEQQGQQGEQGQQGQQGQQPGDQPGQQGQQPGQQGQQGQQPGQQGQEGQQGQRGQQGQQQGDQPGQQGQRGQRGRAGERQTLRGGSRTAGGDTNSGRGGSYQEPSGEEVAPDRDPAAPLTGEEFTEWSDRLREVEEMIDDPELRNEAARLRSRARSVRAEFKRHAKEPDWDLVELSISKPLRELQDRVAEELIRRRSKETLVPLDRDPVPTEFEEQVRRYYERLGEGK